MVKIELDINGISFFVNTTWKTDAVPVVGDIVIVDKESISILIRKWLSKSGRGNLMPKMKKWYVF